jgi:hypothetical protein
MLRAPSAAPGRPHRLLASGCALLLLALGIFGTSPDLHARLHAAGVAHDAANPAGGDACAVAIFSSGVPVAPVAVAPADLPEVATIRLTGRSDGTFLAVACHLHPPGRGPPVG